MKNSFESVKICQDLAILSLYRGICGGIMVWSSVNSWLLCSFIKAVEKRYLNNFRFRKFNIEEVRNLRRSLFGRFGNFDI